MKHFLVHALGVLLLAVATPAHAVLLSELIDGGRIQKGDKLFTDFTAVFTGQSPGTAADIDVLPWQDVDGNYGLRFVGGISDLPGGGSTDVLISFKVTATDPGKLISDVHLGSNGTLNGGEGFFGISESVIDTSDSMNILQVDVIKSRVPDNSGTLTTVDIPLAWGDLAKPAKSLWVTKDIILRATGNVPVTLSYVDQTFSQIPEPGSLGLILIGACGLLTQRRK